MVLFETKKEVKEEDKKNTIKKNLSKGLIILGGILLLIGITSIIIKTQKILSEGDFSFEVLKQFIPGATLLIFGIISLQIGKNFKYIFKFLGKFAITISAFFLSGAMILFAFNSQIPELSENIQPSLDYLIVDYLSAQEGLEYEMMQELLNKTIKFETLSADNLTNKQKQYLIDSLNIESIDDLTQEEKEELPGKIISTIYESLKQQNQEELLNSPIPIEQILNFLKSVGDVELTLISMSYLYDLNPNAELIVMMPTENQLNGSIENLNNIREECSNLDDNLICEAFLLSEYNNLIEYISQNDTLPIEINISELESIQSIEKLESTLNEKTSIYEEFAIISIFFLLLGYFLLEKHFKKEEEEEENTIMKTLKEISSQITQYFLLPTIILILLYIGLINLEYIVENIISGELNLLAISTILQLPMIENMIEIIKTVLIVHIITLIIFYSISYIVYQKNKTSNNHS